MSQQQYTWLLALSMLANSQASNAVAAPEEPGAAWVDITARAGRLKDAPAPCANDAAIAVALSILGVVFVWNRAKYLANLAVIHRNRAKYIQNCDAAFLTDTFAESLTVQWLHETGRLFWVANRLCQMNSPLTANLGIMAQHG